MVVISDIQNNCLSGLIIADGFNDSNNNYYFKLCSILYMCYIPTDKDSIWKYYYMRNMSKQMKE